MPQFLRAYAQRADDGGKMGTSIRYVASTENVARDGMVIPTDAWQLDNFRRNPVVLFCHDYYSRPPIGRVVNVEVKDNELLADVEFDQTDEFAVMCERKVRAGIMPACSVGWDTLSFEPPNGPNVSPRVTKADLLDFSVVPIPSDPAALKRQHKRSLESLGREFLKLADDADDSGTSTPPAPKQAAAPPSAARASWGETSADMARLFRPYAQRPDDARKAEYQRLCRDYARHGRTPPEFLTQDECDALDGDALRGHFLEGEPETHAQLFAGMESRAGAVLSARNQTDLEQAVSLIQGVVQRAKKEAEQTDEERALAEIAHMLGVSAK